MRLLYAHQYLSMAKSTSATVKNKIQRDQLQIRAGLTPRGDRVRAQKRTPILWVQVGKKGLGNGSTAARVHFFVFWCSDRDVI